MVSINFTCWISDTRQQRHACLRHPPTSEGWRIHRDYFLAPLTAAFSVAPALNAGTLDALIFSASPVLGLRPVRAARLRTSKLPKPIKAILSPFFKVLRIISSSAASLCSASTLVLPVLSANAATSVELRRRLTHLLHFGLIHQIWGWHQVARWIVFIKVGQSGMQFNGY